MSWTNGPGHTTQTHRGIRGCTALNICCYYTLAGQLSVGGGYDYNHSMGHSLVFSPGLSQINYIHSIVLLAVP